MITGFLRTFLALSQLGFKLAVVDRGLVITDLFLATSAPYLVQALLWASIFSGHGREEILGFSQQQIMFYYAFAIAFGRLNNTYETIEHFGNLVAEGTIDVYLTKPISFFCQRLYVFIGGSFLYYVPIVLIGFLHRLLVSSHPSQTVGHQFAWALVALSTILAGQFLTFLIGFSAGVLVIWVGRAEFILSIITASAGFLNGTLLPWNIWPRVMQDIMHYNPFYFIVAAQTETLLSSSLAVGVRSLCGCVAYVFIVGIALRMLWKRAMHDFRSTGG